MIKLHRFFKTSEISKVRPKGAQSTISEVLFYAFWDHFSMRFREASRPLKLQQALYGITTFTSQGLSFPYRISFEILYISLAPFLLALFHAFSDSMRTSMILGTHAKSSGRQNGALNQNNFTKSDARSNFRRLKNSKIRV
jgi:hypothetical protein